MCNKCYKCGKPTQDEICLDCEYRHGGKIPECDEPPMPATLYQLVTQCDGQKLLDAFRLAHERDYD